MYVSKTKRLCTVVLSLAILMSMILPTGTADAAMAKGSKFVGNIIAGSIPSDFGTYWNQVTPENGTKWGSVEGSRDSMNWGNADLIYNYAKSNGMPFKFHTLVWGSQEPSWIKNLSAADQKAEVLEWIQACAKKYPNAEYVDVVNEPLHAPASYRNAIGGSGSTGWDWVVWTFEQARIYFPNSKLLINDYGIIGDPNAANNYVKIINALKSKGLVDGIGIQCHQFNMDTVTVSTMKNVLNTLGATGLPIYVSELDMTGDDTTQLNRYKEKFPVLYESQYVKGITLWGYQYKSTWIDNTWLKNSSGGERPALTWLKQYLAGAPVYTDTPTVTPTPTIPPVPRSAFSQIEAEAFNSQYGTQTETCGEGGECLGYIENGDYAVFNVINFGDGAESFEARVASNGNGGNIEIRLDGVNGTLIGTCPVQATGGWQNWATVKCNLTGLSGTHDLYLKFTGGSSYLFNVNSFKFTASSEVTPGVNKGDIILDGSINSMDLAKLRQYLLGITQFNADESSRADVNSDGLVNSIDFALVRQYIMGMIIVFPGQVEATPTPYIPTPTAVKPTPTKTQQSVAKFHCFLLLGQSNMAGYAKTQASDKVEDSRVQVLGYDNNSKLGRVKDQWDVACPPLHDAWLDAIGPGDWFGKTMIQKVPAGGTIGLIPCAISGEKIETFMKSGGTKYSWILNRAKLAQQKGGVIDGIIFHQGESNSGQSAWPGKVKTLVEDLRKDLNLGDVPFIAGELLYSGGCASHNKYVNQLPSLISNCYVVSANGLVVDPSDTTYRLHFSHDSSVTLGKRYAEKMIEALGW